MGLQLGVDNKTRWSSWYQVLDRILRKTDAIKLFMVNHAQELSNICFSNNDWDILKRVHLFLQPFASATLYSEGNRASISSSLRLLDSLLFHYEREKVRCPI